MAEVEGFLSPRVCLSHIVNYITAFRFFQVCFKNLQDEKALRKMNGKLLWIGLAAFCLSLGPLRADWTAGLLGPTLVNAKGKSVPVAAALGNKRLIGLYFSAHWCGPCRGFTPELVKFYKDCQKHRKSLEIIFISSDKTKQDMKGYMHETNMPWLAVPFDGQKLSSLRRKFQVAGIPTLVILDHTGQVVSQNGRWDVVMLKEKAYDCWLAPNYHPLTYQDYQRQQSPPVSRKPAKKKDNHSKKKKK